MRFTFQYVWFLFCSIQKRYPNRPIVEFEIAAQEQMKITELRLAKLFSSKIKSTSKGNEHATVSVKKAEGCIFAIFIVGFIYLEPSFFLSWKHHGFLNFFTACIPILAFSPFSCNTLLNSLCMCNSNFPVNPLSTVPICYPQF